jgi:uncharacterized damage-inducible protein DinB
MDSEKMHMQKIAMQSEKEMFLKTWDREFETTLRVLKAYPEARAEFRPHERSKSARELAWVFAAEEKTGIAGVMSGVMDFEHMPKAPEEMKELISQYEKMHKENVQKIKAMADEELDKKMKFFVAPKTMGDVKKMDLLWMFLMDQVHHRGQFSVYLRMAGGKVPSIYGPTADEPWN